MDAMFSEKSSLSSLDAISSLSVKFSIAGHFDVHNLDQFLSKIVEEAMLPFGGTNLAIPGDHSQLKPVRKAPLYKQPDNLRNE